MGHDDPAREQLLLDLADSRKDSGKRWYSHTAWEMISAGNRNPLYDTVASVSTARLSQMINKPDDHPSPKAASSS